MYCPSCREEISDDSTFCANCGAEVGDDSVAVADDPETGDVEAPETEASPTGETTDTTGPGGAETAPAREKSPDAAGDAGTATESAKIAGGLDENVAGLLTYVLGVITGLIFYLIEEENKFVRFHAAQSIIIFGGLIVLSIAITFIQVFLEFIPFVGWIFSLLFGLVWLLIGPIAFVLWIVLMYKAYQGERYKLPIAGDMAEGWV